MERTTSEREYPAENAWLSLASYHAILLGTAPNRSFPVQSKTKKNHLVASTLRTFEPSEPRLQHPRLRSTTNFVYRRNAIVPFFSRSITLIVSWLPGAIEHEPHATAEITK